MTLVALFMIFLVFCIVSAINAIGTHFAAIIAEAEYPDYGQTFKTIFLGYMIFIVVIIVLTVLKMANNFFLFVGWFAVVSWVVYQLVTKLGIVGNKNILIFIGMSVFFYIVIGAILGMIF